MPPKRDEEELDDELEEEDDDDVDDDDDDPDEDKTEDELKAELKQIRASLKTANGSSAKRRKTIAELKRQIAEAGAKPKPKVKADDDEPVDLDAVRDAAKAEAKAEADKVRKADKAELALARAGVTPAKLAKAARLLDLDDIDLNDDGTLDGADEQIVELKKDWPELFATKRKPRQSVAGENDRGGEGAGKPKAKSASERQAAALLGRGRD